jgi:rhodanese-related sulfurtransferase
VADSGQVPPSAVPDVPDVPTVTADELTIGVVLLDVRGPQEWAAGHAPRALHVPADEVSARVAEIPRGREVVVVCHGGGRSSRATAVLIDNGIDARKLAGGMPAYAAAGHPLDSDTGEAPVVD